MTTLFSNNSVLGLTPDGLRVLAQGGSREGSDSGGLSYRIHRLSARLGEPVTSEIIQRYEAGESATALAKEHDVAPSALLNLMRSRKVKIRARGVSDELAAKLAVEYAAGATVAELEEVHDLSHNAVLRALKSKGVAMRPKGRRPNQISFGVDAELS